MTEQPEYSADFRDMIAAILAAGARFIVVGAPAMAAHGVPRATGDFDLSIEPEATNAKRVMAALMDACFTDVRRVDGTRIPSP